MAQITALQPYGVPGRTRTFVAKAAAIAIAIHVIGHDPHLQNPNHVADSDDNLLVMGQIEAREGIYLGGATNRSKFDSGGSLSFGGTARIDWAKITANAVSIENSHGVITGAVATLQTAHDGNFLEVAEEAETPGIEFLVDFVSVVAFNWVNIFGFYDANTTTHALAIQLYNYTQTRWDTFDCMQKQIGDTTTANGYITCNHDFIVPDDTEYIGTGGDAGKVRVRFFHTMGGNAAHDLRLDVVALYR